MIFTGPCPLPVKQGRLVVEAVSQPGVGVRRLFREDVHSMYYVKIVIDI